MCAWARTCAHDQHVSMYSHTFAEFVLLSIYKSKVDFVIWLFVCCCYFSHLKWFSDELGLRLTQKQHPFYLQSILWSMCVVCVFFPFRIYTKANEYKIDLIGFQVRLIIICDFNMTIEMQTTKCSWNGETRPIKWKWDCLCASSQTPHIYKLLQEINGKNHNGKCYLHENGLISSFCMTIDKRLHEYAVATSQTAFSGYKRFYVSIWKHYCFQCNWYMLGIGCDRLALTSR